MGGACGVWLTGVHLSPPPRPWPPRPRPGGDPAAAAAAPVDRPTPIMHFSPPAFCFGVYHFLLTGAPPPCFVNELCNDGGRVGRSVCCGRRLLNVSEFDLWPLPPDKPDTKWAPPLLLLIFLLLPLAATAGAGAIYLYGEKQTYCKTFLSLFFFFFLLFCKLLSCHIVIGINLCVSVFCFFFTFMFLLNLFFSVCTYLYKVYMKLLDRLKGLMTSSSLTLKTKNPTWSLFLFFPLVSCLRWGSGFMPGVWRGLRLLLVLVRFVLFCFVFSFHGCFSRTCISESAQLFCLFVACVDFLCGRCV